MFRLRMIKNRVLIELLGPKREPVERGWRKLQIDELDNSSLPPNIIRVMK
jgi:hypothetical protein